ncbi:MAG: outer membrane beta-barrel protein [Flavobacteriales bacterium]|nr:outer membrane beta-barrel protein [Flavobacteriales bacterium]
MKKWKVAVLSLAMVGATASTSMAQLYVGVKGGATLNSFSGKAATGTDKKMAFGYGFGALVNIGFNRTFSLQPEVDFIRKGGKTVSKNTSDYTQVAANYLEVPILAKAQFGGEKFKGFVVLGPYAGYWIGGKTKSSTLGTESNESIKFDNDISDDGYRQNRIDFGLDGGVGMQYAFGRSMLILDARYGFGLSDMNRYKTEPDGYKKQSNRSMQLSLGYAFRLSKEG